MSILSVSTASTNPYVSALADDFKNIRNDVKTYKSAKRSGDQDQITISQDALNKAMTQFQNDVAGLLQGTQSVNGHHHRHHHRGMKAAGGNGTTTTESPAAALTTPAADNNNSQSQNSVFNVNLTA